MTTTNQGGSVSPRRRLKKCPRLAKRDDNRIGPTAGEAGSSVAGTVQEAAVHVTNIWDPYKLATGSICLALFQRIALARPAGRR
jgi:hypothetical protein